MDLITPDILNHLPSSELFTHYPPSEVDKEELVMDFLSIYFRGDDGKPMLTYDPITIFIKIWEKLGILAVDPNYTLTQRYNFEMRYDFLRDKVADAVYNLESGDIYLKEAFMHTYCVEDIQAYGL